MRKKMGFFQRFLASIGKRLLWWRAEKMDLYVLALMAREAVLKYEEIFDGDLERAINTLKLQFAQGARTYLSKFMDQMKLIVSEDLKDLEYMSKVALWTIMGKDHKKFFAGAKYIPAADPYNSEGVPKFININPRCVMCSTIKDLDLERYKDLNYGEIISYALGELIEMILDFVGYNYKVEVRETRCFLRGDSYCEIVMYLREREE